MNKYNYNGQLHKVITSDGYILELHRITGRANSSDLQVQKPVVLLMHGLMCSSAVWVITGPEKGLGKYTIYTLFRSKMLNYFLIKYFFNLSSLISLSLNSA